jgi:hypothetical protein
MTEDYDYNQAEADEREADEVECEDCGRWFIPDDGASGGRMCCLECWGFGA